MTDLYETEKITELVYNPITAFLADFKVDRYNNILNYNFIMYIMIAMKKLDEVKNGG